MDSAVLLATTNQPLVVGEAGSYYEWKSTEFQVLSEAKLGAGLLSIQPSGFALPHYADVSKIGYVTQGSAIVGLKLRENPEEKVIKLHKGDLIPVPFGSTSWWFNDEKTTDFNVIYLGDTSKANFPGKITYFPLTGPLGAFNGFSAEFQKRFIGLSEEETTKVTQSQTGALILKIDGRDMPEPSKVGIKHLVYNAETAAPNASVKDGGTLVNVTSEEVDVLKGEGLSGAVVKLHKNAMYAPSFSSDSVFQVNYVVKGSGRVQIIGIMGQNALDEKVNAGDLFVVPRSFAVSVIADGEGMEWFSVVPVEKPLFGQLIGETSVLKAMSPRVLQIALNITPELEKQFRAKMNGAEIFFPGSN